jgi:hypothetical protein
MYPFKPAFTFPTVLIVVISLISCIKSYQNDAPSLDIEPELIFHTGFEESSKIVATDKPYIDEMVGIDHTLKEHNDWINDFDNHPNIGNFRLYYEDGDTTQRMAKIVPDPVNPNNNVLQFWIAQPNVPQLSKGRIQADIYYNNGLKEIYQSVRLYIPPYLEFLEEYPGRIWWLNLFELWNNRTWDDAPYPFKISLDIKKPDRAVNTPLYFGVRARDAGKVDNQEYWEEINTQVEVPLGQWITLDTYVKEGDAETGRFYLSLKPEKGPEIVLFDITNCTYHPDDPQPDGFADFNPMKLYTSDEIINFVNSKGKALQVFWDDYRLWKDRRPVSMGDSE